MGKRRNHIITDLDDDRLFPDEVKEEGEAIDFSMTLTQASSLYIICMSALPSLNIQLKTLELKLKEVKNKQETKDVTDAIFVIKATIKDAKEIKEEVAQIINELDT